MQKKYINNYTINYEFLKSILWIKFGYKLVCCQLATTYYVVINKIIHVYFSHMIYLMSDVISLNNTCR